MPAISLSLQRYTLNIILERRKHAAILREQLKHKDFSRSLLYSQSGDQINWRNNLEKSGMMHL